MQLNVNKQTVKDEIETAISAETPIDPVESAKAVGLRYVADDIPGIERQRSGEKGFTYVGADGKTLRDPDEIHRIDSLAIPPAYDQVWICPFKNGHLQATGRDAKGRKQYRYHPLWRSIRDQTKFTRIVAFSQSLPDLRRRLDHDLSKSGLPKPKVLAAIVKLMELTRIRVGNEEYAKTNHSYGITTLHHEHVETHGSKIQFHFRGKSGVDHDIEVSDRRLAKIVKRCQEIPGQELFQYIAEDGHPQDITSTDVNDYLREITGHDFTAKDFRTWAGTVLAASNLVEIGIFTSQTAAKKNIAQALKTVASHLGNRPATCRKYYVHPAVLDAYMDASLHEVMQQFVEVVAEDAYALRSEELAVIALLERLKPGDAE